MNYKEMEKEDLRELVMEKLQELQDYMDYHDDPYVAAQADNLKEIEYMVKEL